jgi:hypothetical protein
VSSNQVKSNKTVIPRTEVTREDLLTKGPGCSTTAKTSIRHSRRFVLELASIRRKLSLHGFSDLDEACLNLQRRARVLMEGREEGDGELLSFETFELLSGVIKEK